MRAVIIFILAQARIKLREIEYVSVGVSIFFFSILQRKFFLIILGKSQQGGKIKSLNCTSGVMSNP